MSKKIAELETKNVSIMKSINDFKFVVFVNNEYRGIQQDRLECIFEDGRFSNDHVEFYLIKEFDQILYRSWSNWQGSTESVQLITKESAIDEIKKYLNEHAERAQKALEQLGYQIPNL